MTNEQINLAIAEACGWKRIRLGTQSKHDPEPRGWLPPWTNNWNNERTCIPNYCADLNAMYDAESKLTSDEQRDFGNELIAISDRDVSKISYTFHIIHATARQRAEAFLRTIGKWEDGE